MTEEKKEKGGSKSGWIIVAVLIAIFALPEIIAVSLQAMKWRPDSTTNRGELVQPARPIRETTLTTLENKSIKFSDLKGKWTMVHFSDAACNETCIKNLYFMRQVKTALGKEQERVQRVFVLLSETERAVLEDKIKDYPGMTVIVGTRENIQELAGQFAVQAATTADPNRIYLVDPLGNLMMTYIDNPSGMIKDLTHLMKTSWSG